MKFRWYCSTKNTSTSTLSHSLLFNLNTLDIKKKIVWIIQNDYFHHNGFKCNPQPIRVKKKTIIQAEMFLVENIFSQKIFCTKTITTNLLKKKKILYLASKIVYIIWQEWRDQLKTSISGRTTSLQWQTQVMPTL